MATTSIWRVNGWLGKVLIYIENPDKTENPDFFEKQDKIQAAREEVSGRDEKARQEPEQGRAAPPGRR